MRQIILLMVLAIIIETVFLSFPFTLLLSMVAVMLLGRKSLWLVFLAGIIIPYWLLKCFMSAIVTPFVYLGVKWLRKEE